MIRKASLGGGAISAERLSGQEPDTRSSRRRKLLCCRGRGNKVIMGEGQKGHSR